MKKNYRLQITDYKYTLPNFKKGVCVNRVCYVHVMSAFLLFFVLFFSTPLSAQHLRLPDEEIFGTFSLTPDSLAVTKDYSEFYRVDSPERLNYRAVLEKMIDAEGGRRPSIYAYLRGNNIPLYEFHLGFQCPKIPELNFYGKYFYEEIDKEFTTKKMYFEWRPMAKYTRVGFRPEVYFQHSGYTSDLYINKSTMQRYGASLAAIPDNSRFLNHLKLSANHLAHDYETEYEEYKEYKEKYWEFDLNINLPRFLFISETDLNIYNYHTDDFHFTGNFYTSFPFFNIFALHIQHSKEFFPSVLFEKSIYINEISELSISNFPMMQVPSLYEYHEYFPFNDFKESGLRPENESASINHAQQIPLNAYLKFSLFQPIEVQMYLNSRYMRNHYYVNEDYMVYEWQADEFLINSVNLEAQKRINNFTIGLESKYIMTSVADVELGDILPWESHFASSLSFAYRYRFYTFGVDGKALLRRYDSQENELDDVFLLSNTHNFDITRNIKLSFNLNNIFNQDYERITGLPSAGFNAEVILRMMF